MKQRSYATLLTLILAIFGASITIIARNSATQAAPGDLDPAWGNGGIVITSFANLGTPETPQVLHTQADGKVIATGYARDSSGAIVTSFIARYNPNGTLDSSFGIGGKVLAPLNVGEYFYVSALQPDGKIVAAGYKQIDGDRDFTVARYNSNGTLDAAFGAGGKVVTTVGSSVDEINDLLLQPDGKIIAVGHSFVTNNGFDFAVVRYNPAGTLDTTFGTGGKVVIGITSGDDIVDDPSALLQPDGKIVVGGYGGVSNTDFELVRLLPNGTLDASFGVGGKVITALSGNDDSLYDLALQPDGKIIAVGHANYSGNLNDSTALVRYNPNGSLDTTFAANGLLTVPLSSGYYVGNSVAVQPNGKILAFGFGNVGTSGAVGFAVARYNADGSPDTSFGTGGRVITKIGANDFSYGFAIALQPNGKIIAAGSTSGETNGSAIVRYLGDATAQGATQFDFDGDGKSDISVFRPANGSWYRLNSSNNSFAAAQFGASNDRIVPADYDGDRRTDIAVFRNGAWYIQQSSDNSFRAVQFGQANDIPVPGDYDGDGRADVAVFRFGTWFILNSRDNSFRAEQFGNSNDIPVIGDFDGDGKQDLAVYRRVGSAAGTWYIQRSQAGFFAGQFGTFEDTPTPADYDGDGRTDLAVYRSQNGAWYLQRSAAGFAAAQFGLANPQPENGDVPTPADFDGDGRADIAVFRHGTWYLQQSTNGFRAVSFGLSNDIPNQSAYRIVITYGRNQAD